MTEKTNNPSRRSFLKIGAGTAAGAVMAAGVSGTAAAQEAQSFDETKSVIVLGTGAAGMAAAIGAAQSGKSVTVYERSPNPGGSSRRSGGVIYLGGGTPAQKANDFEDTPERVYQYLAEAMGFGADLDRIKAFSDNVLDLHDWLVDLGVPFNDHYTDQKAPMPEEAYTLFYSGSERSYPYNQNGGAIPRGHKVAVEGAAGYALMDALMAAAEQLDIEFVFNARARELVTEDGAVTGVVIENTEDGSTLRIGASAGIIVATGGFQFNSELVERHLPPFLKTAAPLGAPEEDGDALVMGQMVGADVRLLERGSPWRFIYPPAEACKGLFINSLGQRFISEDIYGGNASDMMVRNDDGFGYLVIDDAIWNELGEAQDLIYLAHSADTLDELGDLIGVPPGSLSHTVAYYNEHAANHEDPLFHKAHYYLQPLETGPYHAIYVGAEEQVWITLGGLAINTDGQVLNPRNEPIKGLYAAGRAASSFGGIYNSGTSLSDCLFFGRAAGRHVGS